MACGAFANVPLVPSDEFPTNFRLTGFTARSGCSKKDGRVEPGHDEGGVARLKQAMTGQELYPISVSPLLSYQAMTLRMALSAISGWRAR